MEGRAQPLGRQRRRRRRARGRASGGDRDPFVRLAGTSGHRERRGGDGTDVRFDPVRVESSSVYTLWTGRWQVRIDGELQNVGNYSEYADGQVRRARYRLVGRSELTVRTLPPTSTRSHPYIGAAATTAIRRYLAVDNATVSAALVDGERHFEVVGHPGDLPAVGEVRNSTVTGVVSSEGFVRSLEVRFVATAAGTPQRNTYRYTYEQVDETSVYPPAWSESSD